MSFRSGGRGYYYYYRQVYNTAGILCPIVPWEKSHRVDISCRPSRRLRFFESLASVLCPTNITIDDRVCWIYTGIFKLEFFVSAPHPRHGPCRVEKNMTIQFNRFLQFNRFTYRIPWYFFFFIYSRCTRTYD